LDFSCFFLVHLESLSDTQIIHALGSKISLNLLAVGDLPVTVQNVAYEPVSLQQAFITAKGLVLGAKDSYAGKSLKFIFHNTLGFAVRSVFVPQTRRVAFSLISVSDPV
jgi:hypothetical protein